MEKILLVGRRKVGGEKGLMMIRRRQEIEIGSRKKLGGGGR